MGIFDKLFSRRETPAERAAWLDETVRSVASATQGEFLSGLREARRSFEAAETPAWTESWPTTGAGINDDLARQLQTMRARSRGMARNNEWAISYLLKLADNVLGESGIRLQMRLSRRDGSPDTAVNDRVESAWTKFGQAADVAGLSWQEIEVLALNSLAVDGELLYRIRKNAGPIKFQIQLLNPELLDVNLHRDWQGRRVRMGVEIDDNALPVAYWLLMTRPGDMPNDVTTIGRHTRIPADQIRHFFVRHEVGQLRGYPWLSGGARRLWLLKDFEEAAAVASSNAAKRQGFFVTKDGEAPRGFADVIISNVLDTAKAAGKVLSAEEIQAITAAAEKFSTTMPGQYDTLPLGTEFQKYESAWPNIESSSYIKQNLRGWAAARGLSYVTLGNDLEAVNYSSAQVGIVGEREHFKRIQKMLTMWLHDEVFSAALPYLVLATPGLDTARVAVYRDAASWQPRRWQPVDPVKAATAAEINLRLRLTSRRRLILERGDDPDEIASEIEQEEDLYGALDAENTPRPQDATEQEDEADSGKKAIRRQSLVAVRNSSGSHFADI